jgi:hypothetical protein
MANDELPIMANRTRALQSNISPGLLIHTARKPGRARRKRVPNLVAKLT